MSTLKSINMQKRQDASAHSQPSVIFFLIRTSVALKLLVTDGFYPKCIPTANQLNIQLKSPVGVLM